MFYKKFKINPDKVYNFMIGNRGYGKSYFNEYVFTSLFLKEMSSFATRFNTPIPPDEERAVNNLTIKALLFQEKHNKKFQNNC